MNSWQVIAAQAAQDCRYALRWFRREAVLTGSVVLTLAFGVGLNAGVFSVLSGMVFRPRVEVDSASFFQALTSPAARPDDTPKLYSSSVADFEALRRTPGVAELAAWTVTSGRLNSDADTTLLMMASCEFFGLYRLDRPLAGRLFDETECRSSDAHPAALISEQVWRARFHGSATAVGQPMEIDGKPYRVVGILPAGFAGRLRGPGIWIPYRMQRAFYGGADFFARSDRPWLTIEGRSAPGVSRDRTADQMRTLFPGRRLELTNGSLFEDPSNRTAAGSVSLLLMGALGLVLLLSCANVASLLLARAVSRRYETSVRLSMGASPARLLRMAATEGVLLSALSGAASVAIAMALPAVFQGLVPQMPHYPVHTDWVVFAYLAGITLVSGAVASTWPAAESLRTNLTGSLKHAESRTRRGLRLQDGLVGVQAGVSVVLMVGAALFGATERRMVSFAPGFDAGGVLLAPVLRATGSAPFEDLRAKLEAVSGVGKVAFVSSLFWARGEESTVRLGDGRRVEVQMSAASPEFFATLGIGLARGSGLDARRPDLCVVTEAGARALFPGRDPAGQKIAMGDGSALSVAGVARATDLDDRSPVPRVFRVMDRESNRVVALVKFRGDPEMAGRNLESALAADGVTAREAPRTIAVEMGAMGSRFGVIAGFAAFFGASAFLLALIGLYGVIAFLVGRRRKEMGIRLALGASRGDIVREILRSGLKPVAWGLAAGLPIAGLLGAGLGFAFRGTPAPFHAFDPLAFLAAPLLLVAGTVAAMLRPALRASAVDPSASLRQD